MIRMDDVSFQYADSNDGVKHIDLTISDGECVVLTGPSGGGKTTLTRLLNGLAPAFYEGKLEGRILMNEKPLELLPHYEIGRLIGSVFQDPKSQFFSSELPGEVAFACENLGLPHDEIRRRTDAAIHQFSLSELKNRSLDVLSSGEKQRVAIASVAALKPRVYVCDEPTANLDQEGVAQLAEVLRRLKAEGYTLVIAEHRLSWLLDIADRFLYLKNGELLWEKTPLEMRAISEEEREKYGLREVTETPFPELSFPCGGGASLQAQELSCKRKGNLIFDGLSFSAYGGQITAITGHNGAGKTSLALVLSGIWREKNGYIRIHGNPCSASRRKKAVWYSSNDTGTQFFTSSVTEELLLNTVHSDERLEQARELLRLLGLYSHRDVHPATLSGGQKLRLSIACGIFSGRDILIFDEPTSGLDGGNMRIIGDVLRAEAGRGKTILVITHDRELIRRCCGSIIRVDKKYDNGRR